MTDLDPVRLEMISSLLAFDRAAAAPPPERVLPPDVDLDDEVNRLFAEVV